MKIAVKKFGQILTSRPAGKEAALSMLAYFKPSAGEKVQLDFSDVLAVGPSWLDEVLTALTKQYGQSRVVCLPTDNASVIESLRVIAQQHKKS